MFSSPEFQAEASESHSDDDNDLKMIMREVSQLVMQHSGRVPDKVTEIDRRNEYGPLLKYMPLERQQLEEMIQRDVKDFKHADLDRLKEKIVLNFQRYKNALKEQAHKEELLASKGDEAER